MDRNKVLELAQQCQLVGMRPHLDGIYEQSLQQFAALIEREVRVDAEPVGYTNEGYKGMQYANAEAYKELRSDFIERNKLTAPLYKHPTPAVVRQLVEALRQLCSIVEIHQDATGNNFAWAELPDAFEALAKWEGK